MMMSMSLGTGMRLEHRLQTKPHSPIDNPKLTGEAEEQTESIERIEDILGRGRIDSYDKMLHTEAILLHLWGYGDDWKKYLDSPLIAHADAALRLRDNYDAVVAIKEAGVPYAAIFQLMGFPGFTVDYSHHRRKMERPKMDESELEGLKDKRSVLVVDVDFVTGKTLKDVISYLRENDVNVEGTYIGLSRWPGIKSDDFCISTDTVNFDTFWKGKTTGLNQLRSKLPYKRGVIPTDLRVFSPNPSLEHNHVLGSAAARRVARYLKDNYDRCLRK